MDIDVAIVGGGISGLATAQALVRRGLTVAVLERQVRLGGNAVSERFGGFLMEHGPSTVNALSDEASRLSGALGLGPLRRDLGAGIKRRYLVKDGALKGISVHPLGFLVSDYLSLGARLRLLAEFAVPPRRETGEETIAEFAARRFGREFADRVIEPLVAGIYAGAAGELSLSAGFPRLEALERRHGSVIRGIVQAHRRGARMPSSRLFSWRDGIGTLPLALGRWLGFRVRTGVAVRRIRRVAAGFAVDAGDRGVLSARSVVIATQPHVAAALLDGLDEVGAAAAAAIDAPPLAVVFMGYERRQVSHPLDGLGFLAARSESTPLSGAQFCSTMFADRAPPGHVAVAAYFGGARSPDLARLPEGDLVALARAGFCDLIGAAHAPVVARVRRWARGLPQYRLGHEERARTLTEADQRIAGLFLTGNYLAGPSVGACIAQAQATADRVAAALGREAGNDSLGNSPLFTASARAVAWRGANGRWTVVR